MRSRKEISHCLFFLCVIIERKPTCPFYTMRISVFVDSLHCSLLFLLIFSVFNLRLGSSVSQSRICSQEIDLARFLAGRCKGATDAPSVAASLKPPETFRSHFGRLSFLAGICNEKDEKKIAGFTFTKFGECPDTFQTHLQVFF